MTPLKRPAVYAEELPIPSGSDYIRLEFLGGTGIRRAIRLAAILATGRGKRATFRFNDFEVVVYGFDDIELAYQRWWTGFMQRNRAYWKSRHRRMIKRQERERMEDRP